MTSITRFLSSIKSAYNMINPSTLTGAIDTIVVKQEDGTLRCTPFHVRFGKLGVLQNQNNKVYITINGNAVEDLYMQLGGAGEAVFIEEEPTVAANLPAQRHLEPSDSNLFLDPDNALLTNAHPQLSNIDCSPQIINKQIDEQNARENHETTPIYAYEQSNRSNVNVDVLNSTTTVNNHRYQKRRSTINILQRLSSDEDEDHEVEKIISSSKRRSRAKQRDSTPTSLNENRANQINDERTKVNVSLQRKRSASENDLPFFPIDDEKQPSESSTPFVDAHSRMNSIDSRKKLLIIPPSKSSQLDDDGDDDDDDDDNESYTSSPEESLLDDENHAKTTRTFSNPIPIEVKSAVNNEDEEEEQNTLMSAIFSQSAPLTNNINPPPTRMSQSNTNDTYYLSENFSPASSFENPVSLRPSSPKSDTEYELDKSSSQQKTITNRTGFGWHWKWGELPERKRSVFGYFWPSSSTTKQQTKPTEGIYLDDITNIDRSKYLPTIDIPQRSINDDDQESGKGNSVPQSPVSDNETSYLLNDVQLSLCGNLNNPSAITDELFYRHLVPYEKIVNDASIFTNPDLVVRIGGKYYNWAVGSTLIASTSIYQKQLPVEIIEQLQNKPMTPTKTRPRVWWFFSGKKTDTSTDEAKSEALAQVAKSEMVETVRQNQNFIRNNSESDDNEVEALTDKMQEEQQQQQTNSTQKKTMILSSDQLKRLNLKPGMNQVEFSVTTALQGTTVVEANIFFFDHTTKFVISDIDGTITKSDVFGHILPLVGKDWSHEGIAEFFQAIQKNGYQFIYLSARAIGQSRITRNFLKNIKQCGCALPNGPLLISPDTLVTALYREVIAKKPEDFKIECLKNIASLFPNKNPFYAGFGNRINDQWAYTAVGIPVTRIFTINPRGEVVRQKISQVLSTSYKNLHEVVDHVFPTMDTSSASEDHTTFKTWFIEPNLSLYEDDMRQDLEEMSKQQKAKGKLPLTPTLSGTTPTTTVIKPGGEKVLTIAQATENTVKKP